MKPLASLTFADNGSALVAHLVGEVDLSNVDEIRGGLVAAVSSEVDTLILDLTETAYLDSTGIRMLFDLAQRLQARRQQLRLVVDDEALVRRVIVLTQLSERVPLDMTVAEAIGAVDPE